MTLKTLTALASTACGLGCVIGAGYEGLHYSAWANPGAINVAVNLAGAALIFLAVPAVMIIVWFVKGFIQEARQLGLTPEQTAFVQLAAMTAAHEAWREHNQKVSARLTESVMGPVRAGEPWQA